MVSAFSCDPVARRRAAVVVCAFLVPLLLATAPAGGQEAAPRDQLRPRIEAAFEVVPVRGGILLRPRGESEVASIERRDDGWAIDGEPVDASALTERLGEDAELLLPLADLSGDELQELFAVAGAEPPAAAPEATDEEADLRALEAELEELEEAAQERRREIDEEIEARRREIEERMEEAREDAEEIRSSAEERMREHRRHRRTSDTDARVVFGSSVYVGPDESSGEVVSIGGSVTVDGEVMGGAVAIGGPVRVSGTVMGDVVSVGGGVTLLPTARVMGEVVSVGGPLHRSPGAEVAGGVTEVGLGGLFGPWGTWGDGWWEHMVERPWFDTAVVDLVEKLLALALLAGLGALLLVLARSRVEGAAQVAAREPLKAGLAGILTLILFVIGIPLVTIILVVSIIGIPLLLLWPFVVLFALLALVVFAVFGYLSVAYALGRWCEGRFGKRLAGPVVALVLGLVVLHAWSITGDAIDVLDGPRDFAGLLVLALALFGFLLKLGAWSVGLGAVMMSRFRPASPPEPALAPPPAPAPPPEPEPLPAPAAEPEPERDSGIFWPGEEGEGEGRKDEG